jgi:hypothetical protein
MTYKLQFNTIPNSEAFHRRFHTFLEESRFKCEIRPRYGKPVITLHQIRLKESKPYCGNHPGRCELGGPKRKGNFLEGADWVGFNDMVNSVLDNLDISAYVSSVACVMRRGKDRCVEYIMGSQGEWAKFGRYEMCCLHEPPVTKYPQGTPGVPEWMLSNNLTSTWTMID